MKWANDATKDLGSQFTICTPHELCVRIVDVWVLQMHSCLLSYTNQWRKYTNLDEKAIECSRLRWRMLFFLKKCTLHSVRRIFEEDFQFNEIASIAPEAFTLKNRGKWLVPIADIAEEQQKNVSTLARTLTKANTTVNCIFACRFAWKRPKSKQNAMSKKNTIKPNTKM